MSKSTTPAVDAGDILEQIKRAEKTVKQALLIKRLADLKDLAREVLEAKEETVMILQDIGVKEEDIKRVIDFVNSMPDVQLTEEDKKELRERVRSSGKSKREEVQKQIEKTPNFFGYGGGGGAGGSFAGAATSLYNGGMSGTTSATWQHPEVTLTSGATGTSMSSIDDQTVTKAIGLANL